MPRATPIKTGDLAAAIGQVVACRETVRPGLELPATRTTGAVIGLINRGSARFILRGETIEIPFGALFAVASDLVFREEMGVLEPFEVSYIWLKGSWSNAISSQMLMSGKAISCIPSPTLGLRSLFNEVHELIRNRATGNSWKWIGQLANLLGRLEELTTFGDQDWLIKAGIWIDGQHAEGASTEGLARHLGFTPRQLTYMFQQRLGVAPARWSRQRRIARAIALLEQGDSVGGVSKKLGFANPFHFSRAFKSITGFPPSEVKKTISAPRWHPVSALI